MKAPISPFLKNNLVFFMGTMALSVLNYLYYPVLGRLMGLESFGEVQVLMSIFLQAGIFLMALNMVTVNIASNQPNGAARDRIIHELEKLALYCALGGAVLALIFLAPLQGFLKFHSALPFVGLVAALVVAVPLALRSAFLQGRQDFAGVSVSGIITGLGKLLLSAALVWWGWQSFGAMTGILLAELLALAYTAYRARQAGLRYPARPDRSFRLDPTALQPELRYSLLVLIVSLVTAFLFSGDVIIVKHYFSSAEAGAYAGIATIARIIFFATGSIAGVLLATVKLSTPAENRHVLRRSLLFVVGIGGAAELLFMFWPQLVIGLLMGRHYLPNASLLPVLGLAILVISIDNLLLTYLMALRRWSAAVIAVLGLGFTGGLMSAFHGSFNAIALNLLYGSLFIVGLLLGWAWCRPGRIVKG